MSSTTRPQLGDRFRILRPLGRGAGGSAYLATDRGHGDREVAVKVFGGGSTLAPHRRRYTRRFRALARVAHPNIARVFDFDLTGHSWFYTGEVVEGEDVERFLKRSENRNGATVLAILARVASALEQLRRRGLVHGDCRPANVLCRREEGILRAKLVDFGRISASDSVASDLRGFARRLLEIAPAALETDKEAARLLRRVATTRPGERLEEPRAVLAAIRELDASLVEAGAEGAAVVGREAELAVVQQALREAQQGRPHRRSILIHGESGSGRSSLLEEARVEAILRGFRTIHYRPETLHHGLSDQDALLERAIEFGFPKTALNRRHYDAAERKLAYTRGLLSARDAGPLAILVDDFELLDADGRDFIEHLASYLALKEEPGLVLVVAAKSAVISEDRITQIPLRPLNRSQLATLAQEITGAVPDDRLIGQLESVSGGRPGVAAEILNASRDRLSVEEGALRVLPGAALSLPSMRRGLILEGARRLPEVARDVLRILSLAPQPVDEKILKRIFKSVDARSVLESLLDAGWVEEDDEEWRISDPLTRQAIASDIPGEERRELHARFVRAAEHLGGQIPNSRLKLIVHHFLEGGLLAESEPWVRRLLEVLERQDCFVEAGQTAMRVAAGLLPKVASNLLENAREWFRKAGRHDEMVEAAKRRLEIDSSPAAKASYARALMDRGDFEGSIPAFDAVLADPSVDPTLKAQCHLWKTESLVPLRRMDDALKEVEAAEATGKADKAYTMFRKGIIYHQTGRNATETIGLLEKALHSARSQGNLELELRCRTTLAQLLRFPLKNLAACLKQYRDASLLAYRNSLRFRAANIDGMRAYEFELMGRHARAIGLAQSALEVGLQSGHWMLIADHGTNLANAAVLHGSTETAEWAGQLALSFGRRTGESHVIETALADLALSKAQRGLMNEAGRLLAEMKANPSMGEGEVRLQPGRMNGLVHWVAGLWIHADEILTPLVQELLAKDRPVDGAPVAMALADARFHLGRMLEPELLDLARKELKYWKNPFATAVYDFVEALIRWKEGDLAGARRLIDAANRGMMLETGKDFQLTALLYRARFTEKPSVAANDAMTVYHQALDAGRLRLAEEAAELVGDLAAKSSNPAGAGRWYEEARRILKDRRSAWFDDPSLKAPLDERERALQAKDRPVPTETDVATIKRLMEIERFINSNADWEVMLRRIMDAMMQLSGAERGLLFLVKDSKAKLRMRRNFYKPELEGADYRFSRTIVDRVHETGEIFHSPDAQNDPRLNGAESPKELGLRSVLVLPLAHRKTITGIVYLDNRKASAIFETVNLELLDIFRQRMGLVIERVRVEEELRQVREERDRLLQQVRGLAQARGEPIPPKRRRERPRTPPFAPILGESQALSRALRTLDRAAGGSSPVLILGETGTGKELAARAVHLAGPRASGPFIAVNCAAMPETMMEGELFGSVRGAFTGADRDRTGLFHAADRGTLFLDEIGEMSPALQSKLLRAVESGEIRRVGSNITEKVDVRIVAASNRDLVRMAKTGNFRPDLLYRLKGMHAVLPPLRQRKDDIPILIEAFLTELEKRTGTRPVVEDTALQALISYDWPGNVRELRHLLESAAVLGEGRITAEGVGELVGKSIEQPLTLEQGYERVERSMLIEALKTEGSAMRAAKRIKVVRSQFYRLIKKYNLQGYLPKRVSHKKTERVST